MVWQKLYSRSTSAASDGADVPSSPAVPMDIVGARPFLAVYCPEVSLGRHLFLFAAEAIED